MVVDNGKEIPSLEYYDADERYPNEVKDAYLIAGIKLEFRLRTSTYSALYNFNRETSNVESTS